jgi:hypothetical protein
MLGQMLGILNGPKYVSVPELLHPSLTTARYESSLPLKLGTVRLTVQLKLDQRPVRFTGLFS